MPDHVHLLIESPDVDGDLRQLMNLWKQLSGHAHRQMTARRLWQPGYYDRVLRADDDRLDVAAYLLANPLRAGLVSDVRDYPFWGSNRWNRAELLEAVQMLRSRGR